MQFIVALIAILIVVGLLITFWYVPVTIISIWALVRVIRHFRMVRYFRSVGFQAHLGTVRAVVSEHNDIANYARAIREEGQFQIGVSSTGVNSDLATFENTSRQNYRRDRHTASFQDRKSVV